MKESFTVKLAQNGQMVIPKRLRDLMKLSGGDAVWLEAEIGQFGVVSVELRKRTGVSFQQMIGKLGHLGESDSYQKVLMALDEEEAK